MRISFDLKKGVVNKVFLTILLGVVATFVIANNYPGNTYAYLDKTQPWHTLHQISNEWGGISVDADNDSAIDFANWAYNGLDLDANHGMDANIISKGCEVVDTGYYRGQPIATSLGGFFGNVSEVGYGRINIAINQTYVRDNICEDGDGCRISVVEYNVPLPSQMPNPSGVPFYGANITRMYNNGSIMLFQSPKSPQVFSQLSSAVSSTPIIDGSASWMSSQGKRGINGNGVSDNIISWLPAGGSLIPSFELFDDQPMLSVPAPPQPPWYAFENYTDSFAVRDNDPQKAFIVSICD